MRIGIYGGSFNPIHKGHVRLASSLVSQKLVDEVWLMVSPLNPLKQGQDSSIAGYQHRVRMAELATQRVGGVSVSDFESHLPLPSYTVSTLEALRSAYPQHEFVLVIGADNWACFDRWYRSDEITAHHDVLVYRRPGCDVKDESLPPRVHIVDTPLYDISSTQLRQSFSQGITMHEWVDEQVARYIRQNKLYQ